MQRGPGRPETQQGRYHDDGTFFDPSTAHPPVDEACRSGHVFSPALEKEKKRKKKKKGKDKGAKKANTVQKSVCEIPVGRFVTSAGGEGWDGCCC
jgi:hypothetical protein